MEVLIFLLPVFTVFEVVSILALTVIMFGFIITCVVRHSEDKDEVLPKWSKKAGIAAIVFILILAISAPLTSLKDSYKTVLMYRAINSETADKVVENANTFLDVINGKLESVLEEDQK